jgi:hypothetical protein
MLDFCSYGTPYLENDYKIFIRQFVNKALQFKFKQGILKGEVSLYCCTPV